MYRMRSYIRNQVCHLLIMPLRTCSGSPRAFGSRSAKRHGTDTTTTLLFPPREGGIMVQDCKSVQEPLVAQRRTVQTRCPLDALDARRRRQQIRVVKHHAFKDF